MRGGSRKGAGRKKKPEHLRRIPVTIRLPKWMVSQIKMKGEIGYLIELELATKKGFLDLPDDYLIGSGLSSKKNACQTVREAFRSLKNDYNLKTITYIAR